MKRRKQMSRNDSKRSEYEGMVYETNNYGTLVVTKYVNSHEVYVKFVNTGYEMKATMRDIKLGKVKDKFTPSVFFVGVVGNTPTRVNGIQTREYCLWRTMLQRCYDSKTQEVYPTYKGCTVSENFKSYTYFHEWCNKQIGFDQEGWQLDKDILIKGNKVYSEDTCCFVPFEVNNIFTNRESVKGSYLIGVSLHKHSNKLRATLGVQGKQISLGYFEDENEAHIAYKKAKEAHVRGLADKYENLIDGRVYRILASYTLENTFEGGVQ